MKVVLSLILFMPILGVLGIFPEPTADLYNTKEAYEFITLIMGAGYINWIMSIVFIACLVLIFKNKMALVALLLLPITINIVGFHMFLDGGLFTSGAIMGNVFFLINLYFLCENREKYKALL